MLYVVEILPYTMRAKGISLFWLITGAAGAFNTYVNPIGLKAFGKGLVFIYLTPRYFSFTLRVLKFIELCK